MGPLPSIHMLCTLNIFLDVEWCSSPRETQMVGWCVVGTSVRDIFADLSGNAQDPFLAAH